MTTVENKVSEYEEIANSLETQAVEAKNGMDQAMDLAREYRERVERIQAGLDLAKDETGQDMGDMEVVDTLPQGASGMADMKNGTSKITQEALDGEHVDHVIVHEAAHLEHAEAVGPDGSPLDTDTMEALNEMRTEEITGKNLAYESEQDKVNAQASRTRNDIKNIIQLYKAGKDYVVEELLAG